MQRTLVPGSCREFLYQLLGISSRGSNFLQSVALRFAARPKSRLRVYLLHPLMPSSRPACRIIRNARLAAGLTASMALFACGGGGGGGGAGNAAFFVPTAPQPATPAPAGTSGESTVLMRVKSEAVGGNCTLGGARVDAGLDADNNHVLADSEVTSTQYICNATAGVDGLSTLVRMRAEPAGGNCAQGGSQVLAGKDLNRNDVLEDAEVTSSAYVCGGGPGATGAAGSNGRDSLLAFAAEAPGGTCTYGGQRVQSGLDLNANGVLDAAEVTATAYVCAAAPADTRWVNVTASSVQTESNTGYQANSSTGVTLTLPPAPTVGDWIKVVGVGSGGWTIAQNAGQRIDTRGLPGGSDFDWRSVALTSSWSSLASSADATRLAAASSSGDLYTSSDSGATWGLRLTGQTWSGVASSSDGLALLAATNGGALFRSTDGGSTWANDGSSRAWSAVASSADGSRLVATAYLGQIWTSSDGGSSWTARESNRAWRAVASSADGRVLVAATNGAQLYVSTDYGVSWTARASGQFWWSAAVGGRQHPVRHRGHGRRLDFHRFGYHVGSAERQPGMARHRHVRRRPLRRGRHQRWSPLRVQRQRPDLACDQRRRCLDCGREQRRRREGGRRQVGLSHPSRYASRFDHPRNGRVDFRRATGLAGAAIRGRRGVPARRLCVGQRGIRHSLNPLRGSHAGVGLTSGYPTAKTASRVRKAAPPRGIGCLRRRKVSCPLSCVR
jgi:hypothetical protein